MIQIVNVSINRFRSILSLNMAISNDSNLIALCGQNNVGKTNTLRAINLFFYPDSYEQVSDIPNIKHATGGQSVHSKIEITFFDSSNDEYYCICRDMKDYSPENSGLSGYSYKLSGRNKIGKIKHTQEDIENFVNKIEFVYIESINTIMSELIEKLTEGIIDVQYNKARFTESKKNLKASYDTYVDGLQEILTSFANEISDVFKSFQDNWSVKFNVPHNSDSFRDLISDDVTLTLNDNGSEGVLEKGAGLQRLATILLNFEMLKRMSRSKQIIVCIDEPDVYLHEGLQKKLKNFFDVKSESIQIFYTTHSKIFINPYNMKNVFLLDAKHYEQFSVRKEREINVIETFLVDITEQDGYDRICEHLGIEKFTYELLQKNNLLVEGNCDKKYLTELIKFFNYVLPNIESLNGADNAIKFLEFYNSYYHNNIAAYKPKVKVILDNDPKGREILRKINANNYQHIEVSALLLQNHINSANQSIESNNTNNEIEDFMYPEIMVYLINALLEKKHMVKLDSKVICKKIHATAFGARGILELCEYEKNSRNPDSGADISFISSGNQTNRIKEGLAGLFNIQANKNLLNLLSDCDKKYPYVKQMIEELCTFN